MLLLQQSFSLHDACFGFWVQDEACLAKAEELLTLLSPCLCLPLHTYASQQATESASVTATPMLDVQSLDIV